MGVEFSSYLSGDGDHRPYQAGAEDFPRSTRTGDGTRPHRSRIGSGVGEEQAVPEVGGRREVEGKPWGVGIER